jgi:D-inositol-3-phosphate glycosyltransferase
MSPFAMPAPFPLTFLCLSASWGGLEINTARLAQWLQQRGWPVQVLALADSPLARQAAALDLPVTPQPPVRRKALALGAARRLAQQLRQQGSRVLLVVDNKDLPLAVLARRFFAPGLQLVYQQHMQLGHPKRDWLHTRRYRALAAWLAPLPWLARQVLEFTRLDPARLHVVPLGIELKQFIAPELSQAAARQQLALPAPAQLLGLIGRFDEGKGQLFVVEAFHRLRQELPGHNVQLVLVGESTRNQAASSAYRAAVLARVQELELTEVVHIREFTPQPEVFYRAIDVFVLASANETYGMVTIEAMAAGLPLVATAAGGSLDIVAEGRTGLLYPPGDETALVKALKRLLLDPPYARQLSQAAQQEAQAKYSHERECELLETVLAELPG